MMREYRVEYIGWQHQNLKETYSCYLLADALSLFASEHAVDAMEIGRVYPYKTDFYYTLKLEDDDEIYCHSFDTPEELMNRVCYIQAFSDLDPFEKLEVFVNGHKIEYQGWAPGMRYIWKDTVTDEVVWDARYVAWDH